MKTKIRLKAAFIGIILVFWCFSAVPSIALAAEYYVSTTGNDSTGTGSIGSPYRTIQHVLDNVVVSRDIIILRAGTYGENIRIRKASITIRSMTGEWAVIQSEINSEDEIIAVIFDVNSDGSTLERVEVIGGYWYGIKFNTKWDWGDPNDRSGACNIIIEDCKIHDTGQACVKVTPGCDDITIRRCEIYNSGRRAPDSAEAIDNVNGDRMLVQECYIHDISATGLYAKGGASGLIIDRCWVENCGGAGILVGFDTSPEFFDTVVNPDYYENIDGMVRNSIVINTQYAGIGMYAAKDAKIYNNTLVDVAQGGHSGLYFGVTFQDWEPEAGRPPSINPVIRNNIVVQSRTMNTSAIEIRYTDEDELGGLSALSGMPAMSNNRYYIEGGIAHFEDNRPDSEFSGGLTAWQTHISGDVNCTEGNPEFVDLTGGNYHLSPTSPCIDTGTSDGVPAIDYAGIARPQGQGYDIGAYEFIECVKNPVMIEDTLTTYETLQEAYAEALNGSSILCQDVDLTEALLFDDPEDKSIYLRWGYDCYFSDSPSGVTRIRGSLTVSRGAVVLGEGRLSIGQTPVPQPGTLQFSSDTALISENAGTATITLTRTDGTAGAVSVNCATTSGSAAAGSDYITASHTLQWADGDSSSKAFHVSIVNDSDVEEDETLNLTLSNPTGGATLGSPGSAVLTIVDDDVAPSGHITYTLWNGQVYRLQALEGASPENVSLALDSLSPLPSGGRDRNLNISPDGKWLVLETERFDDDCAGYSCLAVVAGDLSSGDVIRTNGALLRANGEFLAIASGGNLVIYSDGGTHTMDLWAVSRSSGGAWSTPVELTTASSYAYSNWPAISQDGNRVVFNCTNEPYSGEGCICEVGVDGTGFRVVLTPADSPHGLPDTADLNAPDYAPDGSIVFEADWDGEHIWALPAGAIEPVKITDAFNNDNSPCVLLDGNIASLWLNRPGGSGDHELKVMTADGSSYYILLPDIDVADIGLGCGN